MNTLKNLLIAISLLVFLSQPQRVFASDFNSRLKSLGDNLQKSLASISVDVQAVLNEAKKELAKASHELKDDFKEFKIVISKKINKWKAEHRPELEDLEKRLINLGDQINTSLKIEKDKAKLKLDGLNKDIRSLWSDFSTALEKANNAEEINSLKVRISTLEEKLSILSQSIEKEDL